MEGMRVIKHALTLNMHVDTFTLLGSSTRSCECTCVCVCVCVCVYMYLIEELGETATFPNLLISLGHHNTFDPSSVGS